MCNLEFSDFSPACKMRRQKGTSTILIDDVSPRTLTDDFLPRLSVDLAGSDWSYSSPVRIAEKLPPGELAVLEELESIRSMIHSKSKDLHRKEATLSRSINKWNSEVIEAQRLIEELAENLTLTGETRIQDRFNACESRLKKLIDRVTESSQSVKEFKSRYPKGPADVPPLPASSEADMLEDRVLEFISYSPSSIPRQVAAASVLLLARRVLSDSQTRFSLNCIFNAVYKIVSGRFDRLVRQSLESDLALQADDMLSKFSAVKQSVLRKRLGIPIAESTQSGMTLVINEELTGTDEAIDIDSELDDDLRVILRSSLGNADESMPGAAPMIRLCTEQTIQAALCKNLRSRPIKKSVKYRLVDILLGSSSDRMVSDNLNTIKRECGINPTLTPSFVPKLIACLLFILHRAVEDERSIEIANTVCDLLDTFSNSASWQSVLSRFMASWTQGTWFVVRTILNWKGSYVGTRALDSLAGILRASDCGQALVPWQPVIVDRLNKNQFHPAVIPYAKALLKQLGNS